MPEERNGDKMHPTPAIIPTLLEVFYGTETKLTSQNAFLFQHETSMGDGELEPAPLPFQMSNFRRSPLGDPVPFQNLIEYIKHLGSTLDKNLCSIKIPVEKETVQ